MPRSSVPPRKNRLAGKLPVTIRDRLTQESFLFCGSRAFQDVFYFGTAGVVFRVNKSSGSSAGHETREQTMDKRDLPSSPILGLSFFCVSRSLIRFDTRLLCTTGVLSAVDNGEQTGKSFQPCFRFEHVSSRMRQVGLDGWWGQIVHWSSTPRIQAPEFGRTQFGAHVIIVQSWSPLHKPSTSVFLGFHPRWENLTSGSVALEKCSTRSSESSRRVAEAALEVCNSVVSCNRLESSRALNTWRSRTISRIWPARSWCVSKGNDLPVTDKLNEKIARGTFRRWQTFRVLCPSCTRVNLCPLLERGVH